MGIGGSKPTETPESVANTMSQARQMRDRGETFVPGQWLTNFEQAAKAPQIYDPPQLSPDFAPANTLNWATQRSPLCAYPSPPCCCVCGIKGCCSSVDPSIEYYKLSEPDEWFLKMMNTGTSPLCPEHLKGIWWMKDNIASEVLITFHDMDWTSSRVGNKEARYNWTTAANTLYGTVLTQKRHAHFFQISPHGKWINLGETNWIYVLDANDTLKKPDGTAISFTPGEDMMRVSYGTLLEGDGNAATVNHNTSDKMSYQYMMRRVAYKGPSGELVKTPAYEDMMNDVRLPTTQGTCCNYCYTNVPQQQVMDSLRALSDEQAIIFSSAPPGAADVGEDQV